MSEEIYKRGRLLRSLRGSKVRGAKEPVKRDLNPPSALGTTQPAKAQPEWMRSYGSPGPKSFKSMSDLART